MTGHEFELDVLPKTKVKEVSDMALARVSGGNKKAIYVAGGVKPLVALLADKTLEIANNPGLVKLSEKEETAIRAARSARSKRVTIRHPAHVRKNACT